ncbi:hypothetical protein BHAOGJBA_4440 [Methylobacterium hispanicum]|uniref:Uncharacterized protein n=1 Tax=Methylobacterium hispanicum TaxID=270350 RepID=A0AAV4ZST5_9HYPH|nr:hypothetical protein [Methylobacterium hispanicum]GJD90896.1 hypothetical protein BHAOGJBA_4440 [Methylobacterium hispanicum]
MEAPACQGLRPIRSFVAFAGCQPAAHLPARDHSGPAMITGETWFLHFEKATGRKSSELVQVANGDAVAEIRAVDFHRRPNGPAVRASFEDNVRLMAASREMFRALGPLVRAALELGLPENHPLIVDAMAAFEKARPDRKAVVHEGEVRFVGTDDECFEFILGHQGQSVQYALAHGGWAIESFVEDEPTFAWHDPETGHAYRAWPSIDGAYERDGVTSRIVGAPTSHDGRIYERESWEAAGHLDRDLTVLEGLGLHWRHGTGTPSP